MSKYTHTCDEYYFVLKGINTAGKSLTIKIDLFAPKCRISTSWKTVKFYTRSSLTFSECSMSCDVLRATSIFLARVQVF